MKMAALSLLFCLPCFATTIHVPADQPTIQAGIDAASYGDEVVVACGTYTWEGEGTGFVNEYGSSLVQMKSGVYLRSESSVAECVTIDAQWQGRIFFCDGVDVNTSIVGFTIVHGRASGVTDYQQGGGLHCRSSSPLIENCEFVGNEAHGSAYASGGGLYCYFNSSPTITNCTFTDNSTHGDGGGIAIGSNSNVSLTNCFFEENHADYNGGGMVSGLYSIPLLHNCTFASNSADQSGGGLICSLSSPILTNCSFENNVVENSGGGIYCNMSSPSITNCIFAENLATSSVPIGFGGGLSCRESSPMLVRCTFIQNEANYGGGVYCTSNSTPSFEFCTLVGNSAVYGSNEGGGLGCSFSSSPTLFNSIISFSVLGEAVHCYENSNPILECCDIYDNADGDWVDCIADQYSVNGNIADNPLFCDYASGNLRIQPDSPCASENNDCGLMGAWQVGCTAVGEMTWSSVKALY
jgi:predicted outer membrane repeat protein